MLNHILKSRPTRSGTTIERVWTYELAFAEMARVLRPGGRLLVADFRPSRWHRGPHGIRQAQAVDLRSLVEAAGLTMKGSGGVPMMSYVYAVR